VKRFFLVLLAALGCTEPTKSAVLVGTWTGTASGHLVSLTVANEAPLTGSVTVANGPVCSALSGSGRITGSDSVFLFFSSCLPAQYSYVQFSGVLDASTLTGTLVGNPFSSTSIVLQR
jgi:hypothetical protein